MKRVEDALIEAMARLDDEKVLQYAREMIQTGISSSEIQRCLNEGLKQVGIQFESGEYFIADLMVSGMLYRSVLDILSPSLESPSNIKKARVVIGVVEQDIHDIGKDIVVGLLVADDYEVIDLGTDVKPQDFVNAILKYQPQIVLLSGMMHFSQDSMKQTVDAIKSAGLRDSVYILLGGGCVEPTILSRIDADASALDPRETLNSCNKFIENGDKNEK